ncbi:hypothetical protein FRB95_012665 [Tulasnella sp. JGI-2019a]|nr:hypothetical protein FRB95_012665 [Tulasnella sp. JGI-2019a]
MILDQAESWDSQETSTFSSPQVTPIHKPINLTSSSTIQRSVQHKHQRSPSDNQETIPDSEEERKAKRMKTGGKTSFLSTKVGEEWAKEFRVLNRGKTHPTREGLKHLSTRLEALEACSTGITADFLQVTGIAKEIKYLSRSEASDLPRNDQHRLVSRAKALSKAWQSKLELA